MAEAIATAPRFCNLLASGIKFIEKEINNKMRRVDKLGHELEELTSQPCPDPVQIDAKKREIRELEDDLVSDRAQLNAFQEEFSILCTP